MSDTTLRGTNTTELLDQLQLDLNTSFNKCMFGDMDEEESDTDSQKTLGKSKPSNEFYDNITLGINRTLARLPGVCDLAYEKRSACDKTEIFDWERNNDAVLPEDMKTFYSITNGYILYWSYEYESNRPTRVGHIHFPRLSEITPLCEIIEILPHYIPSKNSRGGTHCVTTNILKFKGSDKVKAYIRTIPAHCECKAIIPMLSTNSKIFELHKVSEDAKVCMIYDTCTRCSPKFFLVELSTFKIHFLAETFTALLRMSVVHFGLPYWELLFSDAPLPPWAEQLIMVLAPHLLNRREKRRSRFLHCAKAKHRTGRHSVFK